MLPRRKLIRLKGYNYSSSGWYYVTICVQNRQQLFGKIINQQMKLNDAGQMINQWWLKIPNKFKNVVLDQYQIMPNHVHGIVVIGGWTHEPCGSRGQTHPKCGRTHWSAPTMNETVSVGGRTHWSAPTMNETVSVGVDPCVDPRPALGKIIQWFKTMTTNNYMRNVKNNNWSMFDKRLWQRNYYDHIIRNEKESSKIREYVQLNPLLWDRDRNNPKNFQL